MARIPALDKDTFMSQTETVPGPVVSVEEIQRAWHDLQLRVQQLEAARGGL